MSFFLFFFWLHPFRIPESQFISFFFFCFGMVARDRLLGFFYWVSDRVAGGSTGSYFFSSNSMPSGISYRSVTRSARIGNHAINITEIDGIMGFFFVIKKNAIGRGSSFFFA